MADILAEFLLIAVLILAIVKKSEMSLWLVLVSGIGSIVALGSATPDEAIAFFCGANLILMFAAYSNWGETKLNLPLVIGVFASIDVVSGFIHYIHLMNTGYTSYTIGIITLIIGYLQLFAVCTMKDSKGVMNDILNDSWHLLHSALHLGSNNKDDGHSK